MGLDEDRLRRLIDAGRSLVSERDLDRVLERLLDVARQLTGARYAAIGVLDDRREALADFITAGMDHDARAAIGDLPRGRGVLGMLISDPRPMRMTDVGAHARSYGFPSGHPPMGSFLGVPILVRGQSWGNLYLTDKQDEAEFDDVDEESAVILAAWAAIAVENAQLLRQSERRRTELERSLHALEATTEIARAIGGETRLDRVLELIAKRSRALVSASSLAIFLVDGDDFRVAATAGDIPRRIVGARIARAGSTAGRVLASGTPERAEDLTARLHFALRDLGVEARTGIFAPLKFRGTNVGVIEAFDRIDGPEFQPADERLLLAAAASAATAVATAQSVERERLRRTLQAAEQERRRSARELHDQTLQALAALRMHLASAYRRRDLNVWQRTGEEAIEQIQREIVNLRAIITDLRPPALDEIGLPAALEALFDRTRSLYDIEVSADLELLADRLDPELEAIAYRVVQESLTNAAKHAEPTQIEVELRRTGELLEICVRDDGKGFDPDHRSSGYGLAGMRERVSLAGGELEITTGAAGTIVQVALPQPRHEALRIA